MAELFAVLALGLMLFSLLTLFRNFFLYKIRIFAIERTSYFSKRVIFDTTGESKDRWHEMYDILHAYPSYNSMLFNFRAWGYDEFYPGIEDALLRRFNLIAKENHDA